MKCYDEDGVCDVHGCRLKRVPVVYYAPHFICPACDELGEVSGLECDEAPVTRLAELEQVHVALLHEYGELKASVKRMDEKKKAVK